MTEPMPIPVICDSCRAAGMAGDEAFSAIPDILNFDPVPRRLHANGWTAEHQRAFIAALAITGSQRQAARAIGKHAFGAEQLRRARGGKSFADAWDAALDLARERELRRIQSNLGELADAEAQRDERGFLPALAADRGDCEEADRQDYEEALVRIRTRLLNARRLFLALIEEDPAACAAWETLCGPVDWDKARDLQPQDNEPYGPVNLTKPDMLITAEHGLIAEATGGYDLKRQIREAVERAERSDAGVTR